MLRLPPDRRAEGAERSHTTKPPQGFIPAAVLLPCARPGPGGERRPPALFLKPYAKSLQHHRGKHGSGADQLLAHGASGGRPFSAPGSPWPGLAVVQLLTQVLDAGAFFRSSAAGRTRKKGVERPVFGEDLMFCHGRITQNDSLISICLIAREKGGKTIFALEKISEHRMFIRRDVFC